MSEEFAVDARSLPAVTSEYFEIAGEADVTLVTLHGAGPSLTDKETAEHLRVDFALLASAVPAKVKLLLDLSAVALLGSPVLAGLIELQRKVRETQGLLKLVITQESLHETFRVTKLESHFHIHDSRQGALASFKAPSLNRR